MSQQLQFIALTGLAAVMDQITAATNNLANANTTGFKAQRPVFQALPLYGQGLPDRVDVAARETAADLRPGAIQQTGRSLDIAINGDAWIAVQAKDGSVALTRNGALTVSPLGLLQTSDGHPVLGEGFAPISLPPLQSMTIGEDGTISGVPQGQAPDQIAALNRIMLVATPPDGLQRRADGLFQDPAGNPAPDGRARVQVGALEASNADPVATMLRLIEGTRMFQTQTQLLRTIGGTGRPESTPLSLA
jgi:flagellar basal-body rod protein FlgF